MIILHLSDLHLSKPKLDKIEKIRDALILDLEKCNNEYDVKINLVIFTGDMIKDGDKGLNDEKQYDMFLDIFIEPILKSLNLDFKSLIVCPGNHEVQRNNIDIMTDKGIASTLTDLQSIDDYLQRMSENKNHFIRLSDYISFRDFVDYEKTNRVIIDDYLSVAYSYNFEGFSYGIASINSAWRAFGGEADRHKIIIGEHQIIKALDYLKDCDVKVLVMHHPLNWLVECEEMYLERLITTEFNMVLCGHMHEENSKQINYETKATLFCQAAPLFEGYINNYGYSIIDYNLSKGKIEVYLREYQKKRRVFDKAISIASEGIKSYDIPCPESILITKKKSELIFKGKDDIIDMINESTLLRRISKLNKTYEETFVMPRLSLIAEKELKDDVEYENLNNLIDSNINFAVVGGKEQGKTSILFYTCLQALKRSNEYNSKIPVYINTEDFSKNEHSALHLIYSFAKEYYNDDIENYLASGDCLILIDNLDISEKKKLDCVEYLIKKYPRNRFIISVRQNDMVTLNIDKYPDFGCEINYYYIYTFSFNMIRNFVNKVLCDSPEKEEIIAKVASDIDSFNMTRNPFIISLFITVIEENNSYIPINKASLIEKYIETIFNKLNFDETRDQVIDFDDKMHYLVFLAKEMVSLNRFYFTFGEYINITELYINKFGCDYILPEFTDEFFYKKILEKRDNLVYFKHKSIQEYFIAKGALKDNKLYEYILNEENYLSFSNEIDIMVGLDRENKEIINTLLERVDSSFKKVNDKVNLDEVNNIELGILMNKFISDALDVDTMLNELDDRTRDNIHDSIYTPQDSRYNEIVQEKKEEIIDYTDHLLKNVILASMVVKSSVSIENEDKKEYIKRCAYFYKFLICFLYKIIKETCLELGNIPEFLKDFFNITTILAFQYLMFVCLGNKKQKRSLFEAINETEDVFEKFLLVNLCLDLNLPGFISIINNFVNELYSEKKKHFNLLKILLTKIFTFLILNKTDDNIQRQLIDLVADVKCKLFHKNKKEKSKLIPMIKSDIISKKLKISKLELTETEQQIV